jgi:hypothetical protein
VGWWCVCNGHSYMQCSVCARAHRTVLPTRGGSAVQEADNRVPIRPVFPGTVPFFIQMSRVNFKSPAFSKYPSVFSLINAIWTDKKKQT